MPRAMTSGMHTTYTVEKFEHGAPEEGARTLVSREGLTWDEATKACLELGAVPGTGEANGKAFEVAGEPDAWIRIDSEV